MRMKSADGVWLDSQLNKHLHLIRACCCLRAVKYPAKAGEEI